MKIVRLIAFIPAIIWMIIIFGFSGNNGEESSSQSYKVAKIIVDTYDSILHLDMSDEQKEATIDNITFAVRKVAHFTEYMILAVLFMTPFIINGLCRKKAFIISIVFVILYASTDEIHQLFIPGRAGMVRDVIIDSCGGLLGSVCVFYVSKFIEHLHAKRHKI